jgi:hypothetical protein
MEGRAKESFELSMYFDEGSKEDSLCEQDACGYGGSLLAWL